MAGGAQERTPNDRAPSARGASRTIEHEVVAGGGAVVRGQRDVGGGVLRTVREQREEEGRGGLHLGHHRGFLRGGSWVWYRR